MDGVYPQDGARGSPGGGHVPAVVGRACRLDGDGHGVVDLG